ncbi:hypothetical protein KGF56_004098 [Candida oxycetoniae]|uniref:Small ribosomal subunit protein mS29 n=1 Tax=Candida oxycetoniae TaxID=497107 RepID=A0AAI9WWK2_9ASCO|nr:uncharacterized protein KGF56_004098 [Candida oxycetoniae]KAI3403038.2 hypothetical protein KGF56_004098 [Candida oxycetoniae]
MLSCCANLAKMAKMAKVGKVAGVPRGMVYSGQLFTTSAIVLATPRQKEGKTKQAMRRKADVKDKVKKTTSLTHLGFRDAVRELKFEKLASVLNVDELNISSLKAEVVTKYPAKIEAKLRALLAFKPYQHHELFKNPISLVTSNTERIKKSFVEQLEKGSKTNRIYLDGKKGCGKSTLVNQAIALALNKFENNVVILHMHSADLIGNGTSDYFKNSKLGLYQQPMATKRWLTKLLAANEDVFKKIKLTKDVQFVRDKREIELKANKNTIFDYVSQNREINTGMPTMSFQFFIQQLIDNSAKFPVILSVDDFNAMADYSKTQYFHPDHTPIHINEFELADTIFKFASGELSFEKGGVLLAKSFNFAPKRMTTHIAVYPEEEYDPYMKLPMFDIKIAQRLLQNGGIKPFKVEDMTKLETKALLKFWRDQNVLIVRQDFHKQEYGDTEKPQAEFDEEKQFEKIVQSSYVISQGNPYGLVKQSLLSY